jgi:hypothetical protein
LVDGADVTRKSGAATVLALLVSLLLGYAPAAAQAETDRSTRLGPMELVKRGAALRAAVRGDAEDPETDTALLPPPPRVRTEAFAARPADSLRPIAHSHNDRRAPRAYRARAPPAA